MCLEREFTIPCVLCPFVCALARHCGAVPRIPNQASSNAVLFATENKLGTAGATVMGSAVAKLTQLQSLELRCECKHHARYARPYPTSAHHDDTGTDGRLAAWW